MLQIEKDSPPEEFLIPYLNEFLTRRFEELENLRTSNESHDFPTVKKIAHNWAGISKPYGCESLAVIARDLERMAEEKNCAQISEAVTEIRRYLDQKKELL